MDDYLLIELFKSKAKEDPSFEAKLMEHMGHKVIHKEVFMPHIKRVNKYEEEDIYEDGQHFTEHKAKHLVNKMYHETSDKKIETGEYFDMHRAAAVCDSYKKMYHLDITPEDVYVAINAQYHDYARIFKSWFGSNIDAKIIDSAMCFWFRDDDYSKGSKLIEYFE